ncbi:MAG: zf-HC2 domain-containing protein [Gemmatimonadetes bacterium]|nr:zf-HC2 domain-containing protein [Gemmatimonadota bacterium]
MTETQDEMSCKELVELVTDYVEGALSASDRDRFESHVSECPPCEEYLEQMKLTLRLTGELAEDAIDPMARDRLLAAFRDWKTG